MPPKLGILAGGGDLPARIIDACRDSGRPYFVIAFEDQPAPEGLGDSPHARFNLGAAGQLIERLHREKVEELVMAGPLKRPSLASLKLDLRAAKIIARSGKAMLGDDGLLGVLIGELEGEGFRVVGPDSLLPDLLAAEGVLGAHRPDRQAEADIARGIAVARALGAVDVGQAVVVQQGLVLAVEAIEGTDEMLVRAAALRRDGPGGVLVKVRKPGQEGRADLPAIGAVTVGGAAEAGLRGIAVEAGGALILDRPATIAAADARGLFLIGVAVRPEQ